MRSLRFWYALLAGYCLMLSSARADDDDNDRVFPVKPDGTEAFRLILNRSTIDPLERSGDVSLKPAKTIIILFGEASVRKFLSAEVEQAVREGAALLIAADRNTHRTLLRQLFGVEVTGDTVRVAAKDGYQDEPFWPYVRPKGPAWLPAGKNSPQEFFNKLEASGPKALATCNTSVVKRTWLHDGTKTTLEGIAGYPLSAETARHGKLDPSQDYFAVGGPWGEGQVLILADHSPFYNLLLLADDNANADFSNDLVKWLQTSGKELRTRCLFVDEGKILDDFEIFPQLPFNEEFNLKAQLLQEVIAEAQPRDALNDGFLGILAAEGISVRSVLRTLLVTTSILFLLYCFIRMIRARVKADPARTLVTHEIAAMIPRGGVLQQRFNGQLDVDNLYEMARERIRQEFDPIAGQPNGQGLPPKIAIDASYRDPRQLRRRILRLWEIAYGSRPIRVSMDYWYEILDRLDEVWKYHDEQWWSFEPTPPT